MFCDVPSAPSSSAPSSSALSRSSAAHLHHPHPRRVLTRSTDAATATWSGGTSPHTSTRCKTTLSQGPGTSRRLSESSDVHGQPTPTGRSPSHGVNPGWFHRPETRRVARAYFSYFYLSITASSPRSDVPPRHGRIPSVTRWPHATCTTVPAGHPGDSDRLEHP